MSHSTSLKIGDRRIALDAPTYFIADIASNHDGDLARAKELIWKSKDAGADAVKFQHFLASRIVSDSGFRELGSQVSHQAGWSKSVYEVYEQYELDREWNAELAEEAKAAGADFMTTPYDREAVDQLGPLVPAFKIGSGDLSWTEMLRYIAAYGKPVILATGASTMEEVEVAVEAILVENGDLVLLQCNTNYTGSSENFRFVNLRVLETFAQRWPGMVLGLSDHTPGHAAVLGAVALGARVVEKHFTDDTSREGPDHPFSLDPTTWAEMVNRTRELEAAFGDGHKRVELNEAETVVIQRRCLRAARQLAAGAVLTAEDLIALRPAPDGALSPARIDEVLGGRLTRALEAEEPLHLADVTRS
jgi:sialic acid synthase SpsE